jgi:hypothetical protein
MDGLPWHLYNRRLTNFTDQKQTHLLSVIKEKYSFFSQDIIAYLVSIKIYRGEVTTLRKS